MSCLKISFLASFFLLLVTVHAQEYFFDSESIRKLPVDVSDFILQRNNNDLREHLRYRRDDESARHRRQGGHGGHGGGHEGITGPVHTFVKTDEHAHFKWGVRHHVGHEYAGNH